MTRVWRWIAGIASAVGMVVLAVFGATAAWKKHRLRKWRKRKLEEIHAERVGEAEQSLEAAVAQAEEAGQDAILETQETALREVYDERRTLSDALRDAGAGVPDVVVGDPTADD